MPLDRVEAMLMKKRASRCTELGGILYKRVIYIPLLRCLEREETEYALLEVHEEITRQHLGVAALNKKVLK